MNEKLFLTYGGQCDSISEYHNPVGQTFHFASRGERQIMSKKKNTYNLTSPQLHSLLAEFNLPVHPIWNRPTAWSIALTATECPTASLSSVLNVPPVDIVNSAQLTVYLQRCLDAAHAIGVSPNSQKFKNAVKANSTVQGVGDALFEAA